MKIGIDARLWNQTGVGRYIRNLVVNLQEIDRKNDYVLLVRAEDKVSVKSPNFKTARVDIKWHSILEQLKFTKFIDEQNLDLIHFPYFSVPIFYKKPFVVTIHDLIPLHFQTGKASTLPFPFYKLKFLAYKLVVSRAAKNAKKIITPSNFSKKEVVNLLKVQPSKVKVVYEGADRRLISDVVLPGQKENFLYIGNAYPHKNLELLLEVFNNLPENFKLTMVGKEDYFYKRLKRRVQKLNIGNKIKFFGNATDAELSDLYRKSRALIIPSFIEGFGLPALEAMANRCLVLASDIPVLHEVGSDAAIYFDPKDVQSLKNLIRKVNSDTVLYRSKIELGLKRSREFSWRKTAEQTLEIYENCDSI